MLTTNKNMPSEVAKFILNRRIQNKIRDLAFEKLGYEAGLYFHREINSMLTMQDNVSVSEIINSKRILEFLKKL